jgi:hypothetical protein
MHSCMHGAGSPADNSMFTQCAQKTDYPDIWDPGGLDAALAISFLQGCGRTKGYLKFVLMQFCWHAYNHEVQAGISVSMQAEWQMPAPMHATGMHRRVVDRVKACMHIICVIPHK